MRLFEVTKPNDTINAWIAVRPDWRAVHVVIPWFGGDRIGLGYARRIGFYTLSFLREFAFGPTTTTIPGTKAPPVPGHALDLDADDLQPFLRKK